MLFWDLLQKQPPEVFYKKGVLQNFEKTHRKAPVLESLLNKVAGLIAQISQENTFVRVPPFSYEFCEPFKYTL